MISTVAIIAEEAQTQDPLPPNQPEQSKEPEVPKDTSSDKAAKVSQDGELLKVLSKI